MNSIRVILFGLLLLFSSKGLFAQSATGITAKGKTIVSSVAEPTWSQDITKRVPPDYPYYDRRNYHQGKGWFRIVLDSRTGSVLDVTVKKSTGWATLDAAAMKALLQWRVKPGTWKQFDFPVDFEMARSRHDALEKLHQLQDTKRR